jgi:hypothetical protein
MEISTAPKFLKLANVMMVVTLIITLSAIVLVYGFSETLSMVKLISGHLIIMIMPAIFKLLYVLRLASLKELGLNE